MAIQGFLVRYVHVQVSKRSKISINLLFLILHLISFVNCINITNSHSAVFKFGALLCLLDINLTKQDKPIS